MLICLKSKKAITVVTAFYIYVAEASVSPDQYRTQVHPYDHMVQPLIHR